MADRRADSAPQRPRPRPTPYAADVPVDEPVADVPMTAGRPASSGAANTSAAAEPTVSRTVPATAPRQPGRVRATRPGRTVATVEQPQAGQVVAAAGSAIVSAARVGRLLSRSGWRIAKQLPGVDAVEQHAQRLRQAATAEMMRLLELQQRAVGDPEEHRVLRLVHNAGSDAEPLRSAMTELLDRSADPDRGRSRDYLYGTIVSQLVPDEARILATLATGEPFAVVDVVAKQMGRTATRSLLANMSLVGIAAGIAAPASTPTYLARLRSFGLLEFGPASDDLTYQYERLAEDSTVRAARGDADSALLAGSRLVQRSVRLSAFGQAFWAACAPTRSALDRR